MTLRSSAQVPRDRPQAAVPPIEPLGAVDATQLALDGLAKAVCVQRLGHHFNRPAARRGGKALGVAVSGDDHGGHLAGKPADVVDDVQARAVAQAKIGDQQVRRLPAGDVHRLAPAAGCAYRNLQRLQNVRDKVPQFELVVNHQYLGRPVGCHILLRPPTLAFGQREVERSRPFRYPARSRSRFFRRCFRCIAWPSKGPILRRRPAFWAEKNGVHARTNVSPSMPGPLSDTFSNTCRCPASVVADNITVPSDPAAVAALDSNSTSTDRSCSASASTDRNAILNLYIDLARAGLRMIRRRKRFRRRIEHSFARPPAPDAAPWGWRIPSGPR